MNIQVLRLRIFHRKMFFKPNVVAKICHIRQFLWYLMLILIQ